MDMLYALRTLTGELVDGHLDVVAESFDQVAHNEVSRAIEAVMTVDSDKPVLCPALLFSSNLLLLDQPVDHGNKSRDLLISRWDLGHRREFVVMNTALFETSRVIDRTFVGDVNDILDLRAPVFDKDFRTMRLVNFS